MELRCQQCGEPITYSGRGRPPSRFCSRKCKDASRHQLRRAAAVAEAGERKCLTCGAVIPDWVTLRAKCCSRKCDVAWQNAKRAAARREEWAAEDLRCQGCGEPIPVPESGPRRTRYCSDRCKRRVQAAVWRARSPHYMREYLYGLSQERFESMLAEQDGRCAICRSPDWPAAKDSGRPRVDHDHATGRVRSLLCDFCNRGIGLLAEDPARLRAAAEYLEAHMS